MVWALAPLAKAVMAWSGAREAEMRANMAVRAWGVCGAQAMGRSKLPSPKVCPTTFTTHSFRARELVLSLRAYGTEANGSYGSYGS